MVVWKLLIPGNLACFQLAFPFCQYMQYEIMNWDAGKMLDCEKRETDTRTMNKFTFK